MTGNITCTAPMETAGTYYGSIFATGNVMGSTFALDTTDAESVINSYSLVTLVNATPQPTPVPVPSESPAPVVTFTPGPVVTFTPVPTPSIEPLYFYVGEYATSGTSAHPTQGCLFLETTQDGSDLTASTNADLGGEIQYDPSMYSIQTSATPTTGQITALSISNLSGTSGNGTFTLSDGTTGTVTITGRESLSGQARRHAARLRTLRNVTRLPF